MTNCNTRIGGQILIDQLVAQGIERATCVPGESYLAALDALHDSPIDLGDLPRRGRCSDHGGSLWQAHGPSRHLLRHARPGRHQCEPWRPHCHAGFHPDDPVRRPGRHRHA